MKTNSPFPQPTRNRRIEGDMPIEFKGKQITVMFNPKFFIDTLNVIDDEKISLNIVSEEKPVLSRAKRQSYLSVIMPMRL